MDFNIWMERAKAKIARLQNGSSFKVKQLFEGVEWEALRKGDRIQFGKYFKNEVELGRVRGVVFVGRGVDNSAQYRISL